MASEDEEIVRINIVRGKSRTSVSMDAYLAARLEEKLGGMAEMQEWVQRTAERVLEEQRAGTRHARTGFSRKLQRRALQVLLGVDG